MECFHFLLQVAEKCFHVEGYEEEKEEKRKISFVISLKTAFIK